MFKRIVIGFCAFVVFAAICEGVGLAILYAKASMTPYYWRDQAGQTGDITYVALGDSAAQGVGASDPQKSYVGRIASSITSATGRKVKVYNLSRNGATAHDVLNQQIPDLERLDQQTAGTLIVTLDVGSNDVTHHTTAAEFRRDFEKIVQALPPGQSIVADVPYFGGRIRDDQSVRQVNAIIRELAKTYRTPVAPLYDQLKPRQSPLIYAADLFHPNDRGYAIWYDAFWPKVEALINVQRNAPPVTDQPMPLPPAGR